MKKIHYWDLEAIAEKHGLELGTTDVQETLTEIFYLIHGLQKDMSENTFLGESQE